MILDTCLSVTIKPLDPVAPASVPSFLNLTGPLWWVQGSHGGCSKLLSPCKLCISDPFLKGHSLRFLWVLFSYLKSISILVRVDDNPNNDYTVKSWSWQCCAREYQIVFHKRTHRGRKDRGWALWSLKRTFWARNKDTTENPFLSASPQEPTNSWTGWSWWTGQAESPDNLLDFHSLCLC